MSTDYKFVCDKCKKNGGGFSRQVGGWGNADIIDSFQFIMKHTDICGFHVRIVSENHDEEYFRWPYDEGNDLQRYFPYSADWPKKERAKRLKQHEDYIKRILKED